MSEAQKQAVRRIGTDLPPGEVSVATRLQEGPPWTAPLCAHRQASRSERPQPVSAQDPEQEPRCRFRCPRGRRASRPSPGVGKVTHSRPRALTRSPGVKFTVISTFKILDEAIRQPFRRSRRQSEHDPALVQRVRLSFCRQVCGRRGNRICAPNELKFTSPKACGHRIDLGYACSLNASSHGDGTVPAVGFAAREISPRARSIMNCATSGLERSISS